MDSSMSQKSGCSLTSLQLICRWVSSASLITVFDRVFVSLDYRMCTHKKKRTPTTFLWPAMWPSNFFAQRNFGRKCQLNASILFKCTNIDISLVAFVSIEQQQKKIQQKYKWIEKCGQIEKKMTGAVEFIQNKSSDKGNL